MNRWAQMVRAVVALFIAVLATSDVGAQTTSGNAQDAVRRAALDYLEGFYEGDTAKLVRSVHPEVFKYGWSRSGSSGTYQGERMTWPEFLDHARGVRARGRGAPANAPKDVVVYEVLDQTASAKVTAWWGIDYLLLARVDGRWMITHVLWQTTPPAR